ncbi:transglycosylase SLT domain-containing protein [Phocoenobacter skyensis]|uniref:transglycosylase SLT domain-containing protein n=1 Tax=Phocoenobacter skyensis TaxID=97481 RepID=UPI002751AEB4|nr:transglycosylase SLT domain-containing protein [Pasteurella skyensis]MDP8185310.1 transglycosylase SLT domain-containing protein [Pasteurella skyensis]
MGKAQLLIPIGLLLSSNLMAQTHIVPPAFRNIAELHNVPPTILYAVAMNESSKRLTSNKVKPWPWTINVAGKSYFYRSQKEACNAFSQFSQKYSLKRIDIGIAQVNMGWNGHYFTNTCNGFNPYQNLQAAAQIVRSCYNKHQNWIKAAGCYHHPAGGKYARKYIANFKKKLKKIKGISTQSFYLDEGSSSYQDVAQVSSSKFKWIEPTDSGIVWVKPL